MSWFWTSELMAMPFPLDNRLMVKPKSDTTFYTYTAPILKLYEEKGNMTDFDEFTVTFNGNNVMLKGKPMYESVDLGLPIPVTVKFTIDINAKKK